MRVFAPRRTFGYLSGGFWSGIPLEGDWIDVPDYFNQVTKGNDINDVVHAQLVDPTGFLYTKWDQSVLWADKKSYPYPQCHVKSSTQRWLALAPYEKSEERVMVDPASRYHGDPRKAKPPYERTIIRRTPYGLWVELTSATTKVRKGIDHHYLTRGSIKISGHCEDLPNEYYRYLGQAYTVELHWQRSYKGQMYEIEPGSSGRYWYLLYEQIGLAQVFTDKANTPNAFDSLDEAHIWTLDQLEQFVLSIGGKRWDAQLPDLYNRLGEMGLTPYRRIFRGYIAPCVDQPIVDYNVRRGFMLAEPETIGLKVDPCRVRPHYGSNAYYRNYLIQHAIFNACESLPRLNDNSIQNLVELIGFIKALVVDHKIEIPKSLQNLWLSYRYQYSTTKMDVEDAISFVHRYMDLGTLDRMIVGRGTSHWNFDDGTEVTCRCKVEVTPKNIGTLAKIWRALDTYGLSPDFYVIWDSIPYSFMVDWFLPIGDIASVWDTNHMYFSGEFYTLDNICYSLTYTRKLDDILVKCYTRWAGSVPSSLDSYYWLDREPTSGATIGKRALDAASIFIGR